MAIYFKLLRSGNVVRARADNAEPFFVGKITQYTDKKSGEDYTGIYNIPSALLPKLIYHAQDFESVHGYWAQLIQPTAKCEGGNFLALNTYDRARFTFGFGQFAAHVADGDFVLFFRDLLARPEAADYFPGLELHQGRIVKRAGDVLTPLETSTNTAGLLNLLNPSAATLEDEEQIAGAKLIHWTTQHADVRALQVAHMVATFKRLMRSADIKLNLNGRTAEIAVIVCDILHQGRAKYPSIQQALLSKKPVDSLLQLGAVAYPERLKTLRLTLSQVGDLYRSRVWDRASNSFK